MREFYSSSGGFVSFFRIEGGKFQNICEAGIVSTVSRTHTYRYKDDVVSQARSSSVSEQGRQIDDDERTHRPATSTVRFWGTLCKSLLINVQQNDRGGEEFAFIFIFKCTVDREV
jgi:hypothetical protein